MTNKILLLSFLETTKPFHKTIAKLLMVSSIIASIDAANTYFLSRILNLDTTGFNVDTALFWCAMAILGIITRIFIVSVRDKAQTAEYETKLENFLDSKSINKFLTFSNGQHINQHSGIKQNIVMSGVGSIRGQLGMVIYWLTPFVANFLASMVMLMTVNLYIGLYYFCGAFVLAYFLKKFHNNIEPKVKNIRDIREKASKIKSDIYRHAALIKNEVAETKIVGELSNIQNNLFESDKNTWNRAINEITVIRLIAQFIKWSSIVASIFMLDAGILSIGSIFLIFFWSDKFIEGVWVMVDAQKQFITDKVNIEKYFDLLQQKSDIEYLNNPIRDNLIGDIEFRNVSFHYPNREKGAETKTLLNGLSFHIRNGEKIGVVGESGSGKSTIANLIRRAFDPQGGDIFINGNNLKDIDIQGLLKQVGSVEQEVILFDKTIRENISFGLNRLLTDEELADIAKSSGVYKFYSKLEKGWDTTIGEGGCKLSGGEKQRVGIARALAKKPQILIFDEATSALDIISESEVQEAIDRSCNGKTAIIIAHRLSTVKDCDRIFVMKDGKLLAADNHNNLLKTCNYYQTLIKNQLINL